MTAARRPPDRREPQHLDPDPRYVAGPERVRAMRDRETAAEAESGRELVAILGLCLAVIAAAFVVALLLAAPRSAPYPTVGPSVNDVRPTGGPSDPPSTDPDSSGGTLSGAPHGDPLELAAAVRWAGTATWYCGNGSPCTAGYGPGDLVAAIDTDLGIRKGETVIVRFGKRSVTVRIVDVCLCAGERLIDLTSGAFRRLAPLAYGVLPVTIEVVDSSSTLPPTDVEDAGDGG